MAEKNKYRYLTIDQENVEGMILGYTEGENIIIEFDRQLQLMGESLVYFNDIKISDDIEYTFLARTVISLITDEFNKRKKLAILNPKYKKITCEPIWEY